MHDSSASATHRLATAVIVAASILASTVAAIPQPSQTAPTSAGSAQVPAAPGSGATYRIQKGDQLHIRVFNLPELEHVVRVRPDGRISLLLLGDIDAVGLEPGQLAETVSELYREHFRDPRATVIVNEIATIQVYVGGEVQAPQMMLLDPQQQLSVTAAIFRAGGFRRSGKMNEVVLLRDSGEGTTVVSRIDVKEILKNGAPDPPLQPFDVIYVPKTRIANVNQWVDQYIRQNIPFTISFGFTYLLNGNAVIVP